MSFTDEFRQAVSQHATSNSDFSPLVLIPQVFSYDITDFREEGCLRMKASGSVLVNELFSLRFKGLDCYMLIFTKSGAFEISVSDNASGFKSGSLVIADAGRGFSLRSTTIPWNFKIIFFDKTNTGLFHTLLENGIVHSFTLSEFSPIISDINLLTSMPSECGTSETIQIHGALTSILCRLSQSIGIRKPAVSSDSPARYITEIKNYIETHYSEKFSLDECARLYGVNKYRICRDFQAAYGDSPVHYLNSYRLECAKKLLLTEDLNIHEVSSMVGFENVNHFINLFKKVNGITPGAFRQEALKKL